MAKSDFERFDGNTGDVGMAEYEVLFSVVFVDDQSNTKAGGRSFCDDLWLFLLVDFCAERSTSDLEERDTKGVDDEAFNSANLRKRSRD